MGFLLGVASFGLVLIPLVIIHELGHFIGAKLGKITVLEFGIGFPPRARVLFTRGDTIYTLNWLPIGGFVRPYGEDFVRQKTEAELAGDRREIAERGIKNPKSVFQATPWERLLFLFGGPGINFVAALVLLIVVALVGWPYTRADVTVYDIMDGSPAAAAGLQQGDIIRELDGKPVRSAHIFNDLIRDNTGQPITLLVERDDKQFEITLTAEIVEGTDVERAYITGIETDMPAYAAGLEVEDVITAVDGIAVTSIEQLQQYTRQHEGEVIEVTVLRGDETVVIPVAPQKDSEGTVRMGIQITGVKPALIGLTAINRDSQTYTKALPPGEALRTGFDQFVETHRQLIQFVDDLFSGKADLESARPVSPVGIGQIGGPILEQSLDEKVMYPIVGFAAMISIALAVTNLLPIPGLDGGRILFVFIELIRGKPMEPEREGMIHFIGLLFLLGLIAFTVFNDIAHPLDLNTLR